MTPIIEALDMRVRSLLPWAAAAVFTVAVAAATDAGGHPLRQDATTATIQERLARVRDDVFTRPDRSDASVKELHQLLTQDPSLAEAHLLLGLVHVGRGTADMRAEAAAEFRQALALEPGLAPARFYLARTYLELGQIERAREEMTTLTELAPRSAQFLSTLGETERRLGNPARALELAERAIALEPGVTIARYYQGLALADLGRRDEAIVALEVVAKAMPTVADVQLSLGVAYLRAARTDAAIAALARGIQIGPATPDARIYLARAYRLKGLYPQSEAQLDAALPPGASMEASARYEQMEVDILVERGLIRIAQKRPAAARQLFDKALAMNPSPESKAAIESALAPAPKGTGR